MDTSETKIDRLLQDVARLRARVDSIPTMVDLFWAFMAGSLVVAAYNYLAK